MKTNGSLQHSWCCALRQTHVWGQPKAVMVFNAVSLQIHWAFFAVDLGSCIMHGWSHTIWDRFNFTCQWFALISQSMGYICSQLRCQVWCSKGNHCLKCYSLHIAYKQKHEKLHIALEAPYTGNITYMITDRGLDPNEIEARRNKYIFRWSTSSWNMFGFQ
jgi:hypothetical protein